MNSRLVGKEKRGKGCNRYVMWLRLWATKMLGGRKLGVSVFERGVVAGEGWNDVLC